MGKIVVYRSQGFQTAGWVDWQAFRCFLSVCNKDYASKFTEILIKQIFATHTEIACKIIETIKIIKHKRQEISQNHKRGIKGIWETVKKQNTWKWVFVKKFLRTWQTAHTTSIKVENKTNSLDTVQQFCHLCTTINMNGGSWGKTNARLYEGNNAPAVFGGNKEGGIWRKLTNRDMY